MLHDVCNKQFLTPKTRPELHFFTVFTMFYARTPFFTQKIATSKKSKNHKKTNFLLVFSFFGSRPLPQTNPSQGQFLTVFAMFYAHRALFKKEPIFCLEGGGRWQRHVPIQQKLRQRRMPCCPTCPASDALCIAGFKTGWRL